MDLKQLRTFRAVAELGSLSKASDRLRIAQPALSRQIKLLEHELRTELFLRNGRGMMLTNTGQMLLDRTADLVRQFEQARDDIQSAGSAPAGRVVLGLVPTVSTVLSVRLARRVLEMLPGISLCIVESYGGHLIEWLHRGTIDLAIIYGPAVDVHVSAVPLGHDTVVAIGPPGSGLNERGEVDMEWLVEQKFVLPSQSHGLRALIERAAARKNAVLNVRMEADSYRVLTSLVEDGIGYTLLPPSSVRQELMSGRLESAAIVRPTIKRELILASPTGRPLSIASSAIVTTLFSETKLLSREGVWDVTLSK
ncbi:MULTISPECIES: LysR substrate-binding domain-containing protein [unclassified Chelatococcus]|uniref:LysR family transcriptional regulator n=1 Tax=unclassified Chelatococcus TaxID=2638111 RepID=UPI001BCC4B32|nr:MULTISPECIES: LysR substrate-binding domain-containing protein [unclassified Chelatococcus]MBS7701541.1 LysR family transcriptional regulator [Chelatococcus sp. YT9]MBX3557376.1 LysR family transcriptional regulator [Chelatococcus sp.]